MFREPDWLYFTYSNERARQKKGVFIIRKIIFQYVNGVGTEKILPTGAIHLLPADWQ